LAYICFQNNLMKHINIEHIASGFKLSHKIISKPEK